MPAMAVSASSSRASRNHAARRWFRGEGWVMPNVLKKIEARASSRCISSCYAQRLGMRVDRSMTAESLVALEHLTGQQGEPCYG